MLRISAHKNVNKTKNRVRPLKLESKNQHKKIIALRVGSGWGISSECRGRATSDLSDTLHAICAQSA